MTLKVSEHGVTEWQELEGTSGDQRVQVSCYLGQVTQKQMSTTSLGSLRPQKFLLVLRCSWVPTCGLEQGEALLLSPCHCAGVPRLLEGFLQTLLGETSKPSLLPGGASVSNQTKQNKSLHPETLETVRRGIFGEKNDEVAKA